MTPTVLLYNFEPERARQIRQLCLPLKIRTRLVAPAEYSLTLEDLLDGKKPGDPGESFPDEMLVMADLPAALMNRFLQAFRRKKVRPVALKAVVTASNIHWDSLTLYRELLAEDAAMRRGESPVHEKPREE